ncbi:tRNA (N(6)-L-threonylcarbamoyladenosine(37)-C(2))-methylthiotransferase MtaB, partial [Rhizobium pisi]
DNAVRLAEEADIAHLHVIPYSPRPGTPAARMPQLARSLVKDRAARLRAIGHRQHQSQLHRMVGTPQWLLVENNGLA